MSGVGDKAEKETLRRVQASGAWAGAKGDFRSDGWLVEHKATEASSYRVTLDRLRKAAREALQDGRLPAFHVVFVDGTGKARRGGGWVMVQEDVWMEVLHGDDQEQSA